MSGTHRYLAHNRLPEATTAMGHSGCLRGHCGALPSHRRARHGRCLGVLAFSGPSLPLGDEGAFQLVTVPPVSVHLP